MKVIQAQKELVLELSVLLLWGQFSLFCGCKLEPEAGWFFFFFFFFQLDEFCRGFTVLKAVN